MAQISFQAKVVLNTAFQPDLDFPDQWECDVTFIDNEGAFTGLQIQIGDIVALDTGAYETGTFTFYEVKQIVTPGDTNPILLLEYMVVNDNLTGSPDLSFIVGTEGTISRPTPNYGLLPVVSRDTQIISDRFTEYVQNYNFGKIVDNIGGGGADQVLDNTTPTPAALGGIPAGTTFDNVPVEIVLRDLLYPYQAPAFSSFAISGQTTSLEVGATVLGTSRTFTWGTSNSSNVATNSIEIQNITGGVVSLASGLANDGNEVVSFTNVTKTTAVSHVWRIRANNTNSVNFTRDFTVTWQWRRYFGESTNTTLNETEIKALRVTGLVSGFAGNYAFNAGGYKWLAYPTVFGTATTFKDTSTNLDVPFEAPTIVSITNSFGVVQDYRVHRTTNILGSAITIAVS
jgi:hypothetical protein